jgi:putative ABC transport system permease protein
MRASPGRFLCAAFCIAAGVGAFVATSVMSDAFLTSVQSESKPMLAADLAVRILAPITDPQRLALDQLAHSSIDWTLVTERIAQAVVDGEPRMIVVKAVDVARYPFYGTFTLQPLVPLSSLDDRSAVVSRELALRWNIAPGGVIRIGEQDFQVSAVIASEPDRWAAMGFPFERAVVTGEGFARAGLDLEVGSVRRLLIRLKAGASADEVHQRLEQLFPEGHILDFRFPDPEFTAAVEQAGSFLGLASGASLLLGALAVAFAISSHIEQHLDSVAAIKTLGGRSYEILRIFLCQTMMLTAAGSIAGVALGLAAAHLLPRVLGAYLPIPIHFGFQPGILFGAVGLAIVNGLLFTVLPLDRIRRIPPAAVLRRDMLEKQMKRGGSLWIWSGPAVTCWLILSVAARSARTGILYTIGLLVLALSLAGFGALFIATLRRLPRMPRLPVSVRHGLANVHRPGSYAVSILAVLAAGSALMMGVDLLRHSIISSVVADTAPGSENLFLFNLRPEDRDDLQSVLARTPGVLGPVHLLPEYNMSLEQVNGVALSDSGEARSGRLRRSWVATALDRAPDDERLAAGSWWTPGAAEIVLSDRAAGDLRVTINDRLTFLCLGQEFRVRIAGIGKVQSGVAFRPDLVFPAALLSALPTQYAGGVRSDPPRLPAIEQAIYQNFPFASAIDLAYFLDSTRTAVGHIAVLLRLISLFVAASGALILTANVIASSVRRRREAALFRALGASRAQAAAVATVEFLALGTGAGVAGSIAGVALSALAMHRILGIPSWSFDWPVILVTIAGTSVLTTAVGWLSSFQMLRGSTLEVLREE